MRCRVRDSPTFVGASGIRSRSAIGRAVRRVTLLVVVCVFWAAGVAAQSTDAVDVQSLTPTGYVTDVANVLDARERAAIESYLEQVDRALGSQFAVVIVPSVQPASIEEFSVKLYERWGVGDRERDQGLLLCVATVDRDVRFETGYGLEGALPDGKLGGIIRSRIVPRFRQGDYAGGILDAMVDAAAEVAESQGVAAPLPGAGSRTPRAVTQRKLPSGLVLVIIFIVLAIAISSSGSGGRRRGGWGGGGGPWYGGGFGGGGFGGFGGFGGGGSGGGFGGFGGGSSGGGGASGSW
jgi:uncharacterized protein